MEKLWVVTWSRAIGGDEVPTDSFCGCVGVFGNEEAAKVALQNEKEDLLKGLRKDFSEDADDLAIFENSLRVRGRPEDFEYEIDYDTPDDNRVQYYLRIEEVEEVAFAS